MDNGKIIEDFEWATQEFGLCPNRVWAITREKLHELLPRSEILASGSVSKPRGTEDHASCTFDFCEQTQKDFTSVTQRHECPEPDQCAVVSGRFSRTMLRKAAESNGSTVWTLDGGALLQPPRPYMALSHVWADGTGAGTKRGQVNECLYAYFRDYAEQLGCEGLWWDTICIPSEKSAREKAIRMIQTNYQQARVTLVHDCFLREWNWNPETACFAILMSPWFSRGWTALELAKSRKVKVIFKGPHGPVLKDLDEEILDKNDNLRQSPRQWASLLIRQLRKDITTLNGLLTTLSSRATSVPKDMATIAAFLANCSRSALQQDTFKNILVGFGRLAAGHLFHNSATMLRDFRWCPTNLFKMPFDASTPSLEVTEYGDVEGTWRVASMTSLKVEEASSDWLWNDIHPMIRHRLENALTSPESCVLLAEVGRNEAKRALLATVLPSTDGRLYCDLVGAVYSHRNVLTMDALRWNESHVVLVGSRDCNSRAPFHEGGKRKNIIVSLHDAVKLGNHAEFSKLLADEHNVPDDIGQLPLHLAAERGDEQMVKDLLSLPSSRSACKATCHSGQTALHRAAWAGSPSVVALLLSNGGEVMARDNVGNSPLHEAAEMGTSPAVDVLVEYLLQNKQPVDHRNLRKQTPLHYAALNGDEEKTYTLIKAGADTTARDGLGWTPLHYAAGGGSENVVSLLCRSTAHVSASVEAQAYGFGWRPLHLAAISGQSRAFDALQKLGARHDVPDKTGWSAASFAMVNSHRAIVERLPSGTQDADSILKQQRSLSPFHCFALNIQQGQIRILINECFSITLGEEERPWSPLLFAVRKGLNTACQKLVRRSIQMQQLNKDRIAELFLEATKHGQAGVAQRLLSRLPSSDMTDLLHFVSAQEQPQPVMAAMILDAGARINAVDVGNTNRTPLHMATLKGYVSMVALLLDRGADVNAPSQTSKQETPLHLATNGTMAEMLIEAGADVQALDSKNVMPFGYAASAGHEAVIRLLLSKGADVNISGLDLADSPLHRAALGGHLNVAKLLIDSGADVNEPGPRGDTVLHRVAKVGDKAMVEMLLKEGADINARDNPAKEKPIYYAVHENHADIVKFLLTTCPDLICSQDFWGNSLLHVASSEGHVDMVQLLLQHGADVSARNKGGRTPLAHIIERVANSQMLSRKDIIIILLKQGASLYTRNNHGDTPLDRAEYVFTGFKEMLLQWAEKYRLDQIPRRTDDTILPRQRSPPQDDAGFKSDNLYMIVPLEVRSIPRTDWKHYLGS